MIGIQITDYSLIIAFWLTFTRWIAILIQLPLFDNTAIPNVVKVLTSLIITFAFFPFIRSSMVSEVLSIGVDNFWYMTIFNVVVGLAIGLLAKSIMNLFIASGAVMTQQIGFASVSYFDPSAQSRVGPFEKMIKWTVLIMILSSGALLPMFKGVVASFFSITMKNLGSFSSIHIFYHDFFKGIFSSSLLLATPILFTNLVLNLVMGIIARTIPQMNILMVSFVVNIGVGLFVFFTISEEFFQVAYGLYVDNLANWFNFIKV